MRGYEGDISTAQKFDTRQDLISMPVELLRVILHVRLDIGG
jgi:hypothetical protein